MRIQEICYHCLEGLAVRTAELASAGPEEREKVLDKGLNLLKATFSPDKIPTWIAGEMQRAIRNAAGNMDPFASVKEKEMDLAASLFAEVRPHFGNDLDSVLSLAALGNSIDFFLDFETIKREMRQPVRFARNDSAALDILLNNLHKGMILYFADNAGECYFDLPLIRKMEEYAEVTYVVKESPVQNDLTMEDLMRSGIRDEFKKVITTGTDSPGLDLSLIPADFREKLYTADLLFAKGMGYYETLPDINITTPRFFLLKAKCAPIAESLNVPQKSYVAFLKT